MSEIDPDTLVMQDVERETLEAVFKAAAVIDCYAMPIDARFVVVEANKIERLTKIVEQTLRGMRYRRRRGNGKMKLINIVDDKTNDRPIPRREKESKRPSHKGEAIDLDNYPRLRDALIEAVDGGMTKSEAHDLINARGISRKNGQPYTRGAISCYMTTARRYIKRTRDNNERAIDETKQGDD
jgi:hypothetical protein